MKLIDEYCELIDKERKIRSSKGLVKEHAKIRKRLYWIERKAKQKNKDLYCQLMLYKLCAGMNDLSVEEKEECISFGSAMNAIEGTSVNEVTKNEIQSWLRGDKMFFSVFENTLSRYGFPTEKNHKK